MTTLEAAPAALTMINLDACDLETRSWEGSMNPVHGRNIPKCKNVFRTVISVLFYA